MELEQSLFFLSLRIILGIIFIYHGFMKLIDLNKWTKFIISKNLPSFLGWFSAFFELICGILILFGIQTRLSSFSSIIFMLIAIYLVHINDPINTYFYQIGITGLGIILFITNGNL